MNKLKNIFCIKDFNYIGIIIALLVTIIALNVQHEKEYEWCEYFCDKYGKEI